MTRELLDEMMSHVRRQQASIAKELPEMIRCDQMRKEAQEEPTLSGGLRRAIHSGPQPLSTVAEQAGITVAQLDEFLTGERTLRSDVLDRLAGVLGFRFHAVS